jgi:hypothetical protein
MSYQFNPFTGSLDKTGAKITALNLKGTVAAVADLADIVGPGVGDVYVVDATGDAYVYNGAEWDNIGPLTGPQGEQGIPGEQGEPGADGILVGALDDLTDVDLTTTPPGDGEALVYDDDSGNWVPGAAGGGGTPGGADTQIQFNDDGSFGGSADLTWDDTGKVMGVRGDVNLDDGGANQTTLQLVTPTAARTITFPDATGTVGLVAGSTTEAAYASLDGGFAGAVPFAWDGSFRVDGSFGYNPTDGVLSVRDLQSITLTSPTIAGATTFTANTTFTGRILNSVNSASNAPAGQFTGNWFTTGTSTTNKATLMIQQSGATSTGWSTAGTGLGVNSASTFAGRLLDLQKNATSRFNVSSEGVVNIPNCPEYADDAAAGTGGLAAGDVYRTSTGALRIKL